MQPTDLVDRLAAAFNNKDVAGFASALWLSSRDGGFVEDLFGGLGPDEGLTAVVPSVDEGPDLGREVLD